MDKLKLEWDTALKNLKSINNTITIVGFEKDKYGYKLSCKCTVCDHEWIISNKQYKKNPTCPNCRQKHARSDGCGIKITNEEWVNRAKQIHPEYDYSETEYVNSTKSVKIICPKHGVFSANPKVFLGRDYKCARCKQENSLQEKSKIVLKNLQEVHKDLDFSLFEYNGRHKKCKVICKKHGVFESYAGNLLKGSS